MHFKIKLGIQMSVKKSSGLVLDGASSWTTLAIDLIASPSPNFFLVQRKISLNGT